MPKANFKAKSEQILPARVLHEDDDFITIEVGKHDDVSFTLESGDRFLTMVFVRFVGDRARAWLPWKDGAE